MENEQSVEHVDPQPDTGMTKELVARLAIGGTVLGVVAFLVIAIGSLWLQMGEAQQGIAMHPSVTAIAGMVLSVAFIVGSMVAYATTTLAPASVRAERKRERQERMQSRRNRGGGSIDGTAIGAAAAAATTAVLVTNMSANSSTG